VRSVKR